MKELVENNILDFYGQAESVPDGAVKDALYCLAAAIDCLNKKESNMLPEEIVLDNTCFEFCTLWYRGGYVGFEGCEKVLRDLRDEFDIKHKSDGIIYTAFGETILEAFKRFFECEAQMGRNGWRAYSSDRNTRYYTRKVRSAK